MIVIVLMFTLGLSQLAATIHTQNRHERYRKMASNPQAYVSFTQLDQSGEKTTTKLNTAAAIGLDPPPVLFTDLITALDTELVDGLFTAYNVQDVLRLSNAAIGGGNREDKLLMVYEDNVTKKVYTNEVGCRLGTLTTVGAGSDSVPPATWSATKTAWDAFVKSPDGNATTLIDVRIVGRNV